MTATKRKRPTERERAWGRIKDNSPPALRRLLDRLLECRPEMAPIKVSTQPDANGRFTATTILNCRGHGPLGCYMLSIAWVKQEIWRVQRKRRKEYREDTQRQIGAYI